MVRICRASFGLGGENASPAWWSGLRIEVYGMKQTKPVISLGNRAVDAKREENAIMFESRQWERLSITMR
jgi:hypothetical protein